MRLEKSKLNSYRETVQKIFEFSEKYYNDVKFLELKTPIEVFEIVKNLDYKPDPKGIEFLSRPLYSIFKNDLPRDCDDKTLIISSYATLKNIPFKIAVSGKTNFPHHVFPILQIDKNWIPFDATYDYSQYGKFLFSPKFLKIFSKKT